MIKSLRAVLAKYRMISSTTISESQHDYFGEAAPPFVGGGSILLRVALQSRVDGLALQRQHTEDTLMDSVERLVTREALQRLDAERELA